MEKWIIYFVLILFVINNWEFGINTPWGLPNYTTNIFFFIDNRENSIMCFFIFRVNTIFFCIFMNTGEFGKINYFFASVCIGAIIFFLFIIDIGENGFTLFFR